MMMNKRLIGMVPESRKYAAACAAIQWGSLVVNVAAMTAAARTLAALDEYARSRSDRCPFMETKPSARTAAYIAVSPKCGPKSAR